MRAGCGGCTTVRVCLCFAQPVRAMQVATMKSAVREKTRDDAFENTKTILLDYVLSIRDA